MTPPTIFARFSAEAIGTFALVFSACGVVMADSLSEGLIGPIGVALVPGLVVMGMVYAIGNISGAHMNPAVTLGFTLTNRLSWKDAPVYLVAQLIGSVAAASALRVSLGTAGELGKHIPSVGAIQSLGLEIVITFLLMFVIMSVTTQENDLSTVSGIAIGGMVALGILLGGPISGGSMNPIRSFGPALVLFDWTHHWIYWAGPLLGSAIGAFSYRFLASHYGNTYSGANMRDGQSG